MSYQDDLNALLSEGYISIVTIMDPNGGIYWTNQPQWQVNGAAVLQAWQNKEPGINIGGTRFSVIVNDWEGGNFVGKNIKGQGVIVIVRAPNGYYFLTWSPGEVQIPPTNIHAEVARMAAKFK